MIALVLFGALAVALPCMSARAIPHPARQRPAGPGVNVRDRF